MPSRAEHAGRILALGVLALSARASGDENLGQPSSPPPAAEHRVDGPAPEPAPAVLPAPSPAPAPAPMPSAAAPVPQPAPAAATVPAQPPTVLAVVPAPPPTDASIHIAANYGEAWLEGRSRVDLGQWQKLCPAPCDRKVRVEGLELRMTAPNMTPSNAFIVDPGAGTARLRIGGGSATARELGIVGLAAGLPVTFAGMTLFGLGSLEEEQAVKTAGIVTLAVGAAAIVVALPLLLIGSTTVKNEKGAYIARAAHGVWAF